MRRIMVVALGSLAVSAVCFTVRAAIPHSDPELSLPFLDFLNLGDDKPSCRGDHKDQTILTRNFAWNGADSVAVRMPGTIRYRRGMGEDVSVRARAWVLNHVHV